MNYPIDDGEARAFLRSLSSLRDERNPPDEARRRLFMYKWNRAAPGESMTQKTLGAKLTWANLGYRLGLQNEHASNTVIYAGFDGFATLYHRESR